MAKKAKYSYAQKKAFYSGMGYRAGQENKVIPLKSKKNLDSFRNGYRAAKTAVARYPKKK